ncbi:MAG: SLC13 family permease [Chloroflexi bacterium]|nr:SLC13 family permease [Chloroflexota bacterium]
MSPSTTCFIILAAAVVLFVWNRLPVGIVAFAVTLSLWATGLVDLNQAFAGFGDPVIIFIASLFVVSEALDATGVTTWVGQQLITRIGSSQVGLLVLTMLLAATLSAFITPNGSVAALMPMVVVLGLRLERPPSLLLMPLAFGAHAGSLLLLTGTGINVIVSEAAADAGLGGFGFFEFALAGVPLVLGSVAIVVLFGERLLPRRTPNSIPPNLGDYARTMVKQYHLAGGLARLRVEHGSPLVGTPRSALDIAAYPDTEMVGVYTSEGAATEGAFHPNDVLVVRGATVSIRQLATTQALAPYAEPLAFNGDGQRDWADSLLSSEVGVAELIIPPRSAAIGMRVFPGMAARNGNLLILAIQRGGETLAPRETALAAGDALLVQGTWEALRANEDDADVLVVDSPDMVRRQAAPMGPGARRTIGVLIVMVVLLASGVVPAAIGSLLAACALIVLGVLSPNQAYRAISWTVIVLVGGMVPLSHALQSTGAAELIAQGLVRALGDAGPYGLLLGLILITAVLGQLISNTATALMVIPIALSAAAAFGVSGRPMLMAVNVMSAAAFLTPVAMPANMLIMGPGGYQFNDYWKLGLPTLVWFSIIALVWVPLIWRF